MNSFDTYQHSSFNEYVEKTYRLNSTNTVVENCNNELINRFIELLNSQYAINHNVSDYAAQLGINPKFLLRLCKKEKLKKPSEIIQLKLLFEAKKQLLFTNKSIRNICFELGFYDPAYFSRFFKKHNNTTAKGFRSQYVNGLKIT